DAFGRYGVCEIEPCGCQMQTADRRPARRWSRAATPTGRLRVGIDGRPADLEIGNDESLMILGGNGRAAGIIAAENVLVETELDRRERGVAVVVQLDRFVSGDGRLCPVEAAR